MRIAILTALLFAALPIQASASDREVISYQYLLKIEKRGVRHYKRGDYEKAFEALGESARWGLKQSQYFLGFMFLKGQHVDQSIVLGMGWLGVALEADIDEWTQTFETIYEAASPEMRARIDVKVAEYVEKFGAKTQRVTCTKRPQIGSRRPHAECFKVPETITPWYELELTERPGEPAPPGEREAG